MKYLVKTRWWSLFDHNNTPEEQRIDYRIVEAESAEKLVADHEEEQKGWLDGGEVILEVYEVGELKYKLEVAE